MGDPSECPDTVILPAREWAVFTLLPSYGGTVKQQAYLIKAETIHQDGSKIVFHGDRSKAPSSIVACFPLSQFAGAYVVGRGVFVEGLETDEPGIPTPSADFLEEEVSKDLPAGQDPDEPGAEDHYGESLGD